MNWYIFVAVVLALLGSLYFVRVNAGARFFAQHRPKPDLRKANNWTIGPIVNGVNASLNMPPHPAETPGGLVIDMPNSTCQPHYVTINYGALTGKSKITLAADVEGGPFFAKDGVSSATICLYFQRVWDNWDVTIGADPSAMADQNQNTQYYRWFATVTGWSVLVPGKITLTAKLTDKWTALRGDSEDSLNPNDGARYFQQAIDSAGEVGLVLGGGDGWGHGIMSPNPSRITITSIVIE